MSKKNAIDCDERNDIQEKILAIKNYLESQKETKTWTWVIN